MQRKVVGALLVALTLGIAACGGTEPQRLTAHALRAQANAICQRAQAQTETAMKRGQGGTPQEQVRALLPIMRRSVESLEALSPPAALEERYTQLTASMSTELDVIERAAADDGQPAADSHAQVNAIHRTTRIAKDLGVPACL